MSEQNTDSTDELSDEERKERIAEIREKEPLTRLFTTSNAKILLALIDSPRDTSATSIAESAGVNRTTVYEQRDDLLDLGLIEKTRTEGGSPMYDIADSPAAEKVVQLSDALLQS